MQPCCKLETREHSGCTSGSVRTTNSFSKISASQLFSLSPDSLRDVIPIPLPGLAVVRGKRLTPKRTFFVPRVPTEHHDDRFTFKSVLGKKMPDPVFKRADHRRIENTGVTGDPIQAPESGLRIEKPQGESFKTFPFHSRHRRRGISIHVGRAAEDFGILIVGIELGPVVVSFQPFVEPAIMHLPFPDQKIEVALRRCRRSGDLEITLGVELHFGNPQRRIGRQNCLLRNAGATRTRVTDRNQENRR
jgi:hypothetical protein